MIWWRWFALGLGVGLGALGVWRASTWVADRVVADFVQQVSAASLQRPSAVVFSVRDVPVGGQQLPAIAVTQPSRIAWDVTLPSRARIEAQVALPESAWTRPGSGVLFRIGISHGEQYEELFAQVVDPFADSSHRRWIPVDIDLSPFAGKAVSLIFNTGGEGLWGAPRLVVR